MLKYLHAVSCSHYMSWLTTTIKNNNHNTFSDTILLFSTQQVINSWCCQDAAAQQHSHYYCFHINDRFFKNSTYILPPHVVSCPVSSRCVCSPADISPVQPIISSAGADRLLALLADRGGTSGVTGDIRADCITCRWADSRLLSSPPHWHTWRDRAVLNEFLCYYGPKRLQCEEPAEEMIVWIGPRLKQLLGNTAARLHPQTLNEPDDDTAGVHFLFGLLGIFALCC